MKTMLPFSSLTNTISFIVSLYISTPSHPGQIGHQKKSEETSYERERLVQVQYSRVGKDLQNLHRDGVSLVSKLTKSSSLCILSLSADTEVVIASGNDLQLRLQAK